jgi:hypothetical protein
VAWGLIAALVQGRGVRIFDYPALPVAYVHGSHFILVSYSCILLLSALLLQNMSDSKTDLQNAPAPAPVPAPPQPAPAPAPPPAPIGFSFPSVLFPDIPPSVIYPTGRVLTWVDYVYCDNGSWICGTSTGMDDGDGTCLVCKMMVICKCDPTYSGDKKCIECGGHPYPRDADGDIINIYGIPQGICSSFFSSSRFLAFCSPLDYV